MSDNWVIGNLQYAINTWNSKLGEIWQLVSQSPENFKGRWNLECYCKYKWSSTSNRTSIACAIFPNGNSKNLSAHLQK